MSLADLCGGCCGAQYKSIYVQRYLAGFWGIGPTQIAADEYVSYQQSKTNWASWWSGGLFRDADHVNSSGVDEGTIGFTGLKNIPFSGRSSGSTTVFLSINGITGSYSYSDLIFSPPTSLTNGLDPQEFSVASPVDFGAVLTSVLAEMASIIAGGEFAALNWASAGGYTAPAMAVFGFNDAPNYFYISGMPANVTTFDWSPYDGSQITIGAEGSVLPNPGSGGPGPTITAPVAASFACYDDAIVTTCQSQALYNGNYNLVQYIMLDDGSFLLDTFAGGGTGIIATGTGDGVTPIAIAVPSPDGIDASFFRPDIHVEFEFPVPMGRVVRFEPA